MQILSFAVSSANLSGGIKRSYAFENSVFFALLQINKSRIFVRNYMPEQK